MKLREISGLDFVTMDHEALVAAYQEQGVVLVRGIHHDLAAFESLSRAFCQSFHAVGTRQALSQAAGDGHTTEVFRQNFILLGHSEGMYRPCPPAPDVCFFLCVTAPDCAGGETLLVDGVQMWREIPQPLRDRLQAEGVTYECLWEPARWQVEFGVESEDDLQRLLARHDDTTRYALADGMLSVRYSAPAASRTRDGSLAFANGVLAHLPAIRHPRYDGLPVYVKASNRVLFGSGEPLSDSDINTLIDAHDRIAHLHRWMANDLLIVDNTRFMHGRTMTAGPGERVLLSRFGRLSTAAAAAYDRWLQGQVQASIDDPRPSLDDAEVRAQFAVKRA